MMGSSKTIIISTPYLDEAEQGDYIVFLKNGKVIKKDSIENLKKNLPAKLFRLLPDGNIFDIINNLKKDRQLLDIAYIRGKYIKYLRTGEHSRMDLIPHVSVEEEEPKLEDIYIYYERQETGDVS